MNEPRLMIDLFAGAGGLSLGLESAGYSSVYANEVVPTYADTYAANHPHAWTDSRDIRLVDAGEIRAKLGLEKRELALLAGGPPCQGFSVNAPFRSSEDKRNHLFLDYLKFVEEFEPDAVLIENVPGLVSFDNGSTLEAILVSLSQLGYQPDVRILYAPHFGVPQTRWRTVVLAVRNDISIDQDLFPAAQHSAPARVNFTSTHRNRNLVALLDDVSLPGHVTVSDALSDLPILGNGEMVSDGSDYRVSPQNQYQRVMRNRSQGVLNHRAPRLGKLNMERLEHIPAGGNWTNIPEVLLPAGMRRANRGDHTKRYGRALATGLSSTILTKCDPHWGAYFHYEQDRTFTVREAARIQSFPDDYRFVGSLSDQFAQVGNAVPPLLATAIGQRLLSILALAQKLQTVSLAV
jgi:DNA (cytosine-5)-methyltransferase 1